MINLNCVLYGFFDKRIGKGMKMCSFIKHLDTYHKYLIQYLYIAPSNFHLIKMKTDFDCTIYQTFGV